MTVDFKTPGVYIKEIISFPPSVAAVETAIPAFIGYTMDQKHLTDQEITDKLIRPVRISSMVEYQNLFGGADPEEGITVSTRNAAGEAVMTVNVDENNLSKFKMFYSLQFFFANGGGPCYIVSVGKYGAVVSADDLSKGLEESNKVDEVTLILFPDGQGLSKAADYYDLQVQALDSCAELMDRFVIMDVYRADQKVIVEEGVDPNAENSPVDVLRLKIGTDNLKYGAAYYPNVDTSLDYVIDETKVQVDGKALGELQKSDNELYFNAISALRGKPLRLGPSAGIAGIYADTDSTRGVWKAPANVNMDRVIQPSQIVSHEQQKGLNVDSRAGKSINVIRSFPGRGPAIVWGARTLAGNDNEWRYIPVRRFCNMVEESVKNACNQFVFEPNDANTWVRVRAMIENFLILQWRAGALQGAKPDHAFYVAVGLNQTMTALDVLEGKMIVQIGMAIVRPAEFIVLEFRQMMAQS